MSALEFHPAFDAEALFHSASSEPDEYGKRKLKFYTQCFTKSDGESNFVSFEKACDLGAALVCKVDERHYQLMKHLLTKQAHLMLKVCPIPWKMEKSSGVAYNLVEIEEYSVVVKRNNVLAGVA